MDCKNTKEQIFEMLDDGMTTVEIAKALDVCRATVSRAKQEWKKGRNFTPTEKIDADALTSKTKISDASVRIHKLEPVVLNAIYRSEKWQTVFFSDKYNAYFDGDDKINHTVFEFFKWAVKKVGYMPSQDRITVMFDESLRKAKTPFTQDETSELYDVFEKAVWSLDENTEWLDSKCEEYITVTESMMFCEKARSLILGDGSVEELKAMMYKAYEKIDIPNETSYDLCNAINGSVSQFYPFFIQSIDEKIKGLPTGVNVLCGMTGSGKTMACINQEVFLAKKGIPSIHFVLGDLTALEYQCRVLSHLSQIEYYKIIRDGGLQNQLREKYFDVLKYIKVSVSTDGKTIDGYLRDVDKLRKRQANNRQPIANFIVFDYDDLIGTKAADEWKRAEEIYLAAQKYGMDNGCCILMVSQPTKESETAIRKGDRTLQLTDISGGRKKANIAAVAIGLSVGKKEEGAELAPVTAEVLKGRNGGYGTQESIFFDGNKCTYVLGLVSDENMAPDDFNGFENELPF